MVATDSYRLAVKRTELEQRLGGELEANIPARALRELSRILSTENAEEATIWLPALRTPKALTVPASLVHEPTA